MLTATRKLRPLPKGRTVGRKRQPQKPEVRRTMAGKFGAHIAELARQANVSAKQIGDALGKTDDTVRLYFAGEATPHVNDWPKLAKVLGVSVKDLLP